MDDERDEALESVRRARWSTWQIFGLVLWAVLSIGGFAFDVKVMWGVAGVALALSAVAALRADRSAVSGRRFPGSLDPDGFDDAGHYLQGRTLIMVISSLVVGTVFAILGLATGFDDLLVWLGR